MSPTDDNPGPLSPRTYSPEPGQRSRECGLPTPCYSKPIVITLWMTTAQYGRPYCARLQGKRSPAQSTRRRVDLARELPLTLQARAPALVERVDVQRRRSATECCAYSTSRRSQWDYACTRLQLGPGTHAGICRATTSAHA